VQIQLLGTKGCHLCDLAERMARQIVPVLGFKLAYLDIAQEDALVDQYGERIPVLKAPNGQELGWPFEEEQLIFWLEALNA